MTSENNPEQPVTPVTPLPVSQPQPQVHVYGGQPVMMVKGPTNPIGTGGGVTGIVGLALIWLPFVGGILCLLGAILGGVGLNRARRDGLPQGMAITGLVTGTIGVLIYLAFTLIFVAAGVAGSAG
jgi:hypothetical protein